MNGVVIFCAVLGIPALLFVTSIWRGYVLSVLWGWFFVPVFHAPALSIPYAIGISLVVSLMTYHRTGNEAEKEERDGVKFANSVWMALLMPALGLLIGWIVTKFI